MNQLKLPIQYFAEQSPTLTPPVASVRTELWYAETEDTALKQVFGVQSIPSADTAPEDVTYRTLESGTEFAVSGVRPYESIEIELIYYKEQYTALKALNGKELYWYAKLPDASAGSGAGAKPLVVKWRGSCNVSLAEIAQDDMIKCTLKIGKSSVPEDLEGLPSASE